MILNVSCITCGRVYPLSTAPYKCVHCGGLFDTVAPLQYSPAMVNQHEKSMWRYAHSFGLPDGSQPVSLGEGNTPLVWANVFGRTAAFKCEHLNPTGSFKDRGTSLLVTWLKSRGIETAVEDSSGNAGAAFAAYAARAGIRAMVYVPEYASGPKRMQIAAYGAKVIPVAGSRADVAEAVVAEAEQGAVYASHAHLPHGFPAYATAAYEIFEQLQKMPAAVVTPVGQGGLLLGLYRGFEAIRQAGLAVQVPRLIAVQTQTCDPLHQQMHSHPPEVWAQVATLAEGICIQQPLRVEAMLQAIRSTRGSVIRVQESEIIPGRDELARRGLYVEPTSAVVWSALRQILPELADPVVVMLTGSGFKYL